MIAILILSSSINIYNSYTFTEKIKNYVYTLGLDKNSNGIRDDVEVEVNKYKDPNIRQVLEASAKTYQKLLKNYDDLDTFEKNYIELLDIENCGLALSSRSISMDSYLILDRIKSIKYKTLNNPLRVLKFKFGHFLLKEELKGYKMLSFSEGIQKCNFKVSNLANIISAQRKKGYDSISDDEVLKIQLHNDKK